MKRWMGVVLVLLVVGGGIGVWQWKKNGGEKAGAYRTARVERGDLVQTVRATGTVQPIKLVQVGTQVNGPVRKLYVDYNDRVKQGDLVAQIDPTTYEARLAQDQANLRQSEASVDQAQAKLDQAEKELVRAKELAKRDMLSQAELDAAVANRDTLAAQVKVALAAVEQGKAALRLSQANLDYTTIRSPVDGVVIARNVSEGQTVVASMSAQVLFMIATDLKEIQVEASVPEADIGKIREKQPVVFTVDAHEKEFTGTVSQVRMSASTVQNVVTYPVIILAANPEGRLFPGMTANLTCEVDRRTEVLKIPNAALRFRPAVLPTNAAPAGAVGASAGARPAGGGEGRRGGEGGRRGDGAGKSPGTKLWIQPVPGGPLEAVRVRTGITDGAFTELLDSGPLADGQEIVIGTAETGTGAAAGTVNPFAPRMPGGGGRPH